MSKRSIRTDGGVLRHAIERVIKQYSSPLGEKEIRKIIREEKNALGVERFNNGYFIFSNQVIRKLRLTVRPDRILIGIVSFGTVVTVEDKHIA